MIRMGWRGTYQTNPIRHVYIAGRFEARERLCGERARVERAGHRVVGTWLDEEQTGTPTPAQTFVDAIRDTDEILWQADVLILDTFDEDDRGGREVEYGMAYAGGVETWVVGPCRNIFHHLSRRFETWDSVHQALREGR